MALRRVVTACLGSSGLRIAGGRHDAPVRLAAVLLDYIAAAAAPHGAGTPSASGSSTSFATMPGVLSRQHAPRSSGAALLFLRGRHGVGPRASPPRTISAQHANADSVNGKSTLVLVESPAKARKIEQYLGPGYQARFQPATVTTHSSDCAFPTAHSGLAWVSADPDREQLSTLGSRDGFGQLWTACCASESCATRCQSHAMLVATDARLSPARRRCWPATVMCGTCRRGWAPWIRTQVSRCSGRWSTEQRRRREMLLSRPEGLAVFGKQH
jgi:hypothetical protein